MLRRVGFGSAYGEVSAAHTLVGKSQVRGQTKQNVVSKTRIDLRPIEVKLQLSPKSQLGMLPLTTREKSG